jgi:hypothetical protein
MDYEPIYGSLSRLFDGGKLWSSQIFVGVKGWAVSRDVNAGYHHGGRRTRWIFKRIFGNSVAFFDVERL